MNITSEQPFTVQLMHEGRSAHRYGPSPRSFPRLRPDPPPKRDGSRPAHASERCRSGLIKPGDVIAMIDGVLMAGETVAKLTKVSTYKHASRV